MQIRVRLGALLTALVVVAPCWAGDTAGDASHASDDPERGIGLVESSVPTTGPCGIVLLEQPTEPDRTRGVGMAKENAVKAAPVASVPRIRIQFASGKDRLTPAGEAALKPIGEALKSTKYDLSKMCFRVEGHTDTIGSARSNLELSRRRAESVKRYLTRAYGVDADQMVAVGYGEAKLAADPEDSLEAQQRNRRVEVANLGEDAPVRAGPDTQARKDVDGMDAQEIADLMVPGSKD